MGVNESKNSGIYTFNMIKFRPQWYLLNGTLKINNKIIDIGKCINEEESKNYQKELNLKQQIIEDMKKFGFPEEEINKLIKKINQSQN
jgi:Holliday junction resolvasome RuvABC DNA-binding subunit